jgi:hypothetical protein
MDAARRAALARAAQETADELGEMWPLVRRAAKAA